MADAGERHGARISRQRAGHTGGVKAGVDTGMDPALADASDRGSSKQGVQYGPFRRLVVAWAMSSLGEGVRIAALPLYAAVSTRSPLVVSAVAVAEVLPWLLVALPAGALVDRWRDRTTLQVANGFRAAVTFLLAMAIYTGTANAEVLVACAFVLTSAETFADSAFQSSMVDLAGQDDLERANGQFVSVQTVGMEIAGPLAVAALFVVQPAASFAVNAVVFGLAVVVVSTVPKGRRPERTTENSQSLAAEALAGLRFLLSHRQLRTIVGVVGWTALLVSALNAVAVLYSIDVVRMPASVVPVLLVAMAVGTMIAARVVTRLVQSVGSGAIMIGSLVLLAAGIAGFGLSSEPIGAGVAYFVIGLGVGGWNVLSASKRQRLTPKAMMGRLASAYRVCAWGLMPLGAGIAGPVAALTSLRTVLIGVALLIFGMVVLLSPALRRL